MSLSATESDEELSSPEIDQILPTSAEFPPSVSRDDSPTSSEEGSATLLDDPDGLVSEILIGGSEVRPNAVYATRLFSFFYLSWEFKDSKWEYKIKNPLIILSFTKYGTTTKRSFPYLNQAASNAAKSRVLEENLPISTFSDLMDNQSEIGKLIQQALYVYPEILGDKFDKKCAVEVEKLLLLLKQSDTVQDVVDNPAVLNQQNKVIVYNYWAAVSRVIECFVAVYALNYDEFLSMVTFSRDESVQQKEILTTLIKSVQAVEKKGKELQATAKTVAKERLEKEQAAQEEEAELHQLRRKRQETQDFEFMLSKTTEMLKRLMLRGKVEGKHLFAEYNRHYVQTKEAFQIVSTDTEIIKRYRSLLQTHEEYFDPNSIRGETASLALTKFQALLGIVQK